MRRLLSLAPPGTIAVGTGLLLLGVASYIHLAVAGHRLSQGDYSSVSVLWSIVFTVGPGLFLPVEQEIARLVATRRSRGLPPGPVVRQGGALAAAVLGALLLAVFAGRTVIADRLFAGSVAMVAVLAGSLAALAVAHAARGLLSGLALFPSYGAQLGVDGGLRIAIVAVLGVAGVTSPVWYGLVLVLAPLAAVAITARPVWTRISGGSAIGWRPLLRGLGLLTVSSLLSQAVVNVGVINARLLAPSDLVTAGALLSALVLVRIPLFVFASLQASLLPGLSASTATGDTDAFRSLLRRALAIVTALGLTGSLLVVLLGPWLVRALFDAADVLARADFAWLGAATLVYLWALVLGQALLSRGRHRAQATSWVIGAAALGMATLVPLPLTLRVEAAYLIGSAAVATAMGAYLLTGRRSTPPADARRGGGTPRSAGAAGTAGAAGAHGAAGGHGVSGRTP
jgi:O-antigen/teichoic acid export membrane protein